MKRLIAGLIITALFPITALAQKLTVVSATAQKRHGGIRGFWVDYQITLQALTDDLHYDSIYIAGKGYRLSDNRNIFTDTAKCKIIRIHEKYFKGPLKPFDSGALLVYRYKRKKHSLQLEEFTRI